MKESVRIGKFTLESLTTGMYADSRIIFREYIQNATDAIDTAINRGILKPEEGRIDITINETDKIISIRDNGIGIPHEKVWHLLGDIGNSEKRFEQNRGFRGIGRLGGLSYADELQFITSARGESIRTIYYWDCKRLKELLQPGQYPDYDLVKVMDEISFVTTEKEEKEKHFFEVRLEGIDAAKYPELLARKDIENYLSQVAPVPFNAQRFPYCFDAKEGIATELKKANKLPEEYNIYLNDNPNPIYKPYKTWFIADKRKDDITGVEFFKGYKEDGEILFLGWYAKTSWLGTVSDKNLKGLRVRKNNILIGDETTLNDFFTEPRFNGWVIGEVYVYDSNILPNARRDYFENNEAYSLFRIELEKVTRQVLSKLPRKYSDERKEKKNLEEAERVKLEIRQTLDKGITSEVQREELFRKLDSAKSKIRPKTDRRKTEKQPIKRKISRGNGKGNTTGAISIEEKESLISELLHIENQIIDADVYRIEDLPSSYPREVRKVVSQIFEIIDSTLQKEQAEILIDRIIERLKIRSKTEKKKGQRANIQP